MKIAISYFHYAITAAGEYISRAAKRLGHEVKTIGPYFGTTMPYGTMGGMSVSDDYDHKPDVVLPERNSVPIGFVEAQLGDWKPDIWLDVNAGFWLDGRPATGKRITWLTDPHVLRGLYDNILHQYDRVFCSQLTYMQKGEIYIPYGYDPEWCAPLTLEKEYDVTCVGNIYENRVRLFQRLNAEGYRTYLQVGAAKEDAKTLYNQSIVGLNWSSRLDMTARVFEVMAMGIVPVINRVPELAQFFEEGKHYLGFSDENEAANKIKMAVDNPDIAKTIGENARKIMVEEKHSWDDRIQEMLSLT